MKMYVQLLSAAALTVLTTLTACKKETANTGDTDAATEVTTHSDDQSQVSVETGNITNDATIAMESTTTFSGSTENIAAVICDATLTYDTANSTKKITITYNGGTCNGAHIRSGSVVLSMPKGMYWKNAGAVLTVSYQNLKVTRISDNKSITINGTHNITNITGGLLIQLPIRNTITHTITSNDMSITFDNNTQRTWQVAERRVFTYNNGVVITITGNHTEGSDTGIVAWGTNRFGHAFTTSITHPLVLKQDCSFRLTSGEVKHEGWATATATYGLDATGNPASCPGTGNYYFKLAWTGPAGNTHSAILPY